MYWKLLLGSLLTLTLAGTVDAMAQNKSGSIHTNKNTTNSLAGVNDRRGPVVSRAPAIRTHVGRKNGNANTTNSLTGTN